MSGATIYLSLGSNIGEREEQLKHALEALESGGVAIRKRSSIYETEPQDRPDQPWFLNMVVEAGTIATPVGVLNLLLRTERSMGRVRNAKLRRGPRPIDIDLLLYGNAVRSSPRLTVPHPRMLQRRFVLEPLLEIVPDLRHPATQRALREYLPATLDQQVRIKR